MKIKAANYPYPFLSDANDNYINSEFSAETVGVKLNEDTDCFEIEVAIRLENELLEEMIEEGDVSLVVHAECPSTYFNKDFEVSGENIVISIEKNKVAGKIELNALIIANNDIINYTNEDLHPDFQGINFSLVSGNLLGGTSAGEITIDNEIPEKVEAIFKIKSSSKLEPGEFDADYNTNKIAIYLSEKDHYNFQRLLSVEQISPLLHSLVVSLKHLPKGSQLNCSQSV